MKFPGLATFLMAHILYFPPVRAQFYSSGESPSSVHWMQMSSPNFRVVFPDNIRNDATRLIHELERTRFLTGESFSRSPKPVPVLLNNSSVLSNGFVTWAPRRMELVSTPPQDSYAQDWISQLALHEYRHVAQISQLCQGFTSALSILSGEIATGLAASYMPGWFYEGDAVMNETQHSQAGRGRNPAFEMPLRTILMDNRQRFSYNKMLLGSYRDFVPDKYQYGYQMVSYTNARFGNEIWPDALTYIARHSYLVFPLAIYLHKNFHTNKSGLYKQTLDSIKYLYNKQEDSVTYCNYSLMSHRARRTYTNYKLPHDLGGGRILTLKTGMDQRNCFVVIDSTGAEQKLISPGLISGLKYDVHGNFLIWDEITSDPRWGRRDYSELRLYDMKRNKLRFLTKRTRYFSPAFSPDGKTIAVAETDIQDNHFLALISTETGKCILHIPSPDNRPVQFPEWISEQCLDVITVSELGKQIEQINLEKGTWTVILPYTRYDISELLHFRHFILFRSSYNSLENIYALNTDQGQLYQVTFSKSGAFNPTIALDSTKLLFSEYSGMGYDIVGISQKNWAWKEIKAPAEPSGIWPGTKAVENRQISPVPSEQPAKLDFRPYSKSTHLFHFHSWLPFYVPITGFTDKLSDLPVNAGFMLFSQNLLSTFISSIGYHYSGGYHYLTPRFIWKGWYPVIELSGQLGGALQILTLPEGVTLSGKQLPYYDYRIKTYIPLVYDRGRYITYLQPQLEYEHTSTYYFAGDRIRNGLDYLHGRFYIARYLRMSYRDLYPRWGQYVSATYSGTPGDLGQLGSLFSIQTSLYMPGVALHHHLMMRAGYQKQYTALYYLPINQINFPRGYASAVSGEFASFSADYAFPVAYPDFSLGAVIYVKRLRMDLFHDRSYGSDIHEKNNRIFTGSYRSTGTELLADFHFARIIFPISAGVRLGYLHNRNAFFTEFLLSIQSNIF